MTTRCDLCSAVPAVVRYPALDFIVGGVAGRSVASRGSWLACSACDELLRQGDAYGVRHRALRLVGPLYAKIKRAQVESMLAAIVDQFMMHRLGEPQPLDAA